MTHTICVEGGQLAVQFHALLRSIDPARWRHDRGQAASRKLEAIRRELHGLLERYADISFDQRLGRLYEGLQSLARLIDQHRPSPSARAARMREQWNQFRRQLQPAYATLADRLGRLAVPVPALRPTNYGRSLFHFGMGLACVVAVQTVLSSSTAAWAAVGFAAWCWLCEALRVRYPVVTRIYMRLLGRIAHPHEHHRVNSSTWFASALALLTVVFSIQVASVAVIVLAAADPVAGLVGRKLGRTKLRAGRTLEGSLAFVGAGTLAALLVLLICYPAFPLRSAALVALAASLGGAVAELYTVRLDDNVTIPLGAAVAATLALACLGV